MTRAGGLYRNGLLIAGPVLAAIVWFALRSAGLEPAACWCGAVTAWCALWWAFEAVPLPVTALIPFAVLPLGGVLTHREVAVAYGDTLILLMLAGSIISTAIERSGAHRHIAVGMVRLVGARGDRRIVLGFLLASAVLSMWISNTATVVMLLPVALAVLDGAPDRERLTAPLLLAVAYGAAIGGSATPVGTPPNLIFIQNYNAATGTEIGFLEWMRIGVPVVVLMLPLAWLWLTRNFGRESTAFELPEPGRWQPDQKRVMAVLALTALGWLTRSAPFGGWSGLIGAEAYAGDSTVALIAVAVLFALPSGRGDRSRLLDWQTAASIPWGVFIMIGGGVAIGLAFRESGLGAALGEALTPVAGLPLLLMMLALCLLTTFFTEITSNTAVANILMPVMAATGTAAGIDPVLLMVPVTLGTNFAFMLPVATAPNAIVHGTGKVRVARMMREGVALNVLGAVLITGVCYLILR